MLEKSFGLLFYLQSQRITRKATCQFIYASNQIANTELDDQNKDQYNVEGSFIIRDLFSTDDPISINKKKSLIRI